MTKTASEATRGRASRWRRTRRPPAGRAGKLRLDFNENTVGCSPHVIEFLKQRLDAGELPIYPEYADAKRELAALFRRRRGRVLLTNGTDEAIQVLVNTYVEDGDDVLLLRPSYAMYRFYAEVAGARFARSIIRPDDLAFPLEELLAAIRPATRAMLIANPNNPTGTGTDRSADRADLESAPGAAVLIDEAYFEFCGVTALPLLASYPEPVRQPHVFESLRHGGDALGCLFSQAANVAWLHKAQSPYSVNMLAALAARAAVRIATILRTTWPKCWRRGSCCIAGFEKLGIAYFPSHANFVLFHAGERAIAFATRCARRGVLVRDRSYEIPGCVRVTIGTREQIAAVLDGTGGDSGEADLI